MHALVCIATLVKVEGGKPIRLCALCFALMSGGGEDHSVSVSAFSFGFDID